MRIHLGVDWFAIGNFISSKDALNLNVFLLNNETCADAFALTRNTVIWRFGSSPNHQHMTDFLTYMPWGPGSYLRHITRGFSIDSSWLSCLDVNSCCKRNITPFPFIFTNDHLSELIIRLTPHACASPVPCALFRTDNHGDMNTQVAHQHLRTCLHEHLLGYDMLQRAH